MWDETGGVLGGEVGKGYAGRIADDPRGGTGGLPASSRQYPAGQQDVSPVDLVSRALADSHVIHERLPRPEGWDILQRWRTLYAAELRARTGSWTHSGYDWHVFSWGFFPSVRLDQALTDYLAIPLTEANTIIASARLRDDFVFRCRSCRPTFRHPNLDILVFPDSLDWTVAFPHEVTNPAYQ